MSINKLTEMAIPVRIMLQKFILFKISYVYQLLFYHLALQCFDFECCYFSEYELQVLYLAHLANKLRPLKLLTKLLTNQQLPIKLRW